LVADLGYAKKWLQKSNSSGGGCLAGQQ
jgi:hypothetical protein